MAVALPVFVRVRVRLTGRAVIAPKESVAGSTLAPAARAADAFNLPAPTAVTRAVPALSVTFCVAVLTSADLICPGRNPGLFCLTSAAAPAAMAAAKLLPLTPM